MRSRAPVDDLEPGGPRILVVDDELSYLWEAHAMLASYGLSPITAGDGAQAVELACGDEFDLILMDLDMPVLDGFEATKQIRLYEHEHRSVRASVFAYTSRFPDKALLRDCGVDGVLKKPCSDDALQECLLRWCVLRNASQRIRSRAASLKICS